MAHTSGPWMVEPINDGLTFQVTTSEDEGFKVICETPCGDSEDEANAHLSAAGPDMLAALKAADRFMGSFEGDEMQDEIDERIALVRAAIAKAEGRE